MSRKKEKKHAFFSPQKHVIVVCVCYMLVSMLLIGAFFSVVLYNNAYQSAYQDIQTQTENNVKTLENSFSFVSNLVLAVATSQSLVHWVSDVEYLSKHNPLYYESIYKIKKEMQHLVSYSNAWKSGYINYLCVFLNDEMVASVSPKPTTETSILAAANRAYDEIMANRVSFVQEMPPFVDDKAIYHARILKRNFKSEESLVILIATDETILRQQYTDPIHLQDTRVFIVDDAGSVFSSNQSNAIGTRLSDDFLQTILDTKNKEVQYAGQRYLCFSAHLLSNKLWVVTLASVNEVKQHAFSSLPIFIVIAASLSLLLLCIGFSISLISTKFLSDLTLGMEQIKLKNYDVRMPQYRNKEVDSLGSSFNSMAKSMKSLIIDTYEAQLLCKEMELEFLQQQMNPHFLVNILLIIQIKAKLCGDETIYTMLGSLSGLLRASLFSDRNVMTTLAEELKCTKFYLYLQQQRYENRLEYEVEIQPGVENVVLPRLTIEPIVENAVIHCAEAIERNIKISIAAVQKKEYTEIIVRDNGCGFDASALDLQEGFAYKADKKEKIGLKNTNKRLKSLYGTEYGIQIESVIGMGTKIVLKIPRSVGKEVDE